MDISMRTLVAAAVLAVGISTVFNFIPAQKLTLEDRIDCQDSDCKLKTS